MSPLAWFLTLFVAASAICLLLGLVSIRVERRGRRGADILVKRFILLYAVAVLIVLSWMIYYFIGLEAHGSSHIPRNLQRRIEHTGYYFASDGELKLVGKADDGNSLAARSRTANLTLEEARNEETDIIRRLTPAYLAESDDHGPAQSGSANGGAMEHGFVHQKLDPGESITLKPIWKGDKAPEWALTYKVNNRPLRIRSTRDGKIVSRCVNIPPEGWLDSGDTILFALDRGGETRFVSLKWSVPQDSWPYTGKKKNAYHFNQWSAPKDAPVSAKGVERLMSERVLADGIFLSDLIKRSKKEFRDRINGIDQEWWEVFGGVELARETQDDPDSRIGVLITDEIAGRPDLKIYRKRGDGSSQTLTVRDAVETTTIDAAAVIAYGFRGSRKSFELALTSQAVSDDIWGQIVHVTFKHPTPWPLPPSPTSDFIITSSNDYIPLDGYFLDIGASAHPFYAKARLAGNLDELSVNDGRNTASDGNSVNNARKFSLGQPASLGDYEQGVLITLVPARAGGAYATLATKWLGAPYVGPVAIALILFNVLSFTALIYRQASRNPNRPKLFLAWALIWAATLTMLAVRLILTYRVSLISPADATLTESSNIFGKSLTLSLAGLGAFCALTLSLLRIPRKTRENKSNGNIAVAIILWGGLIAVYTILGSFSGSNQSWLIRISIADHLILIGGLALLARRALESSKRHLGWLMALVVFLTLALQIIVVKDAGSIIYSLSLLPCVVILWGWRKSTDAIWNRAADFIRNYYFLRKFSKRSPSWLTHAARSLVRLSTFALPLAAFASLIIIPFLMQAEWIRQAVRPAVPETTFYRIIALTDSEDEILTTKSGEESADLSKLLDNSRQDWQMLLYASHGASDYAGYGKAPLSKIGMTYATSVSDCAFSTYLLAEHGKAAAFLFLLLYFMLACSCILAGWCYSENMRSRYVTIVAIGAFFGCNALYMAGANIGLLPFTGQNLPLLGLNSGGDLLQGVGLVWVAGLLLLRTNSEIASNSFWGGSNSLRNNHPIAFCVGVVLLPAMALGIVAAGWWMGKIGRDERYREDHNFKPEIFDRIEKNLPSNENAPLTLTSSARKLIPRPGGQLMEVEKQYVKQFNERPDPFNPNGGLYYLEPSRGSGEARVKINRRFFLARSPFGEPALWRGQIMAGGEIDPTFYALNNRLKLSLSEGGDPETIDLDDPRSQRANSSVVIGSKNGARRFFELKRNGDQVGLAPYDSNGSWSVFVDGARVREPLNLDPLSVIVIESRGAKKYRRNLIYLGPTRPILAYVRWRNGEQRRMFPEGGTSLVYLIGKAGDRTAALEAKLPPGEQKLKKELTLSLDISLHRSLQRRIARYAGSNDNYNAFRPLPNRLAVTALDAFSGEVLALPAWPTFDPDKPDYEAMVDRLPSTTRYRFEAEGNHNLAPHIAGSTMKPVVFAAMATALRREKIDLEKVIVYNRASAGSDNKSGHLHDCLGGIEIGLWDCNGAESESGMTDFIVHSRDFPQGLIGMLGMIIKEDEIKDALVPKNKAPDLSFDGKKRALVLAKASKGGTAFTIQDQRNGKKAGMRSPEIVNNTVLFRALSSVFDFDNSGKEAGSDGRLRRACDYFLPSFNNHRVPIANNTYLDNVIPERLDMSLGSFQDIRGGLISCLLGGGVCGFNNVMMAEAAARLATGRRIFARLEKSPSPAQFDRLPDPLGDPEWRNLHIITPMRLVGEIGTADKLKTRVKIPPGYKVIYKTGTLIEGKESEGRESETLMFILGKWENGGFARGKTLAGFLYMEKSKDEDRAKPDFAMKKFDFAAPILDSLIKYLERPESD